ncbi:MAG: DUF308 domain-containing protein [bacterium]|nr:DUF308 domain-containing protein [bacterium]
MSEKRFLCFLLIEGIILLLLGLEILILPKVTSITFGAVICSSFIIYGSYKIFAALISKNYSKHYVLNIILGSILVLLGLTLFFLPFTNFTIISSILGLYFILESFSTQAFAFQTKSTLYFWWANIILAIIQFLIGLIIILGISNISFWLVGTFVGLDFLLTSFVLINIFSSNKYLY